MSARVNWSAGDITIENPYETESDKVDSLLECPMQAGPSVYQADQFSLSPSMGSDPILVPTNLEGDFNLFQHAISNEQLESPFMAEPSVASWAYGSNTGLGGHILPDSWTVNRAPPTSFLIDPVKDFPEASHESEDLSPGTPGITSALNQTPSLGCSCYKQAIGELLRSGIRRDTSGISSIDSVLAFQKELLLQTEAILQCKMCSQSEAQANMLMVIIVTIDSLLTSLDAAATSTKARNQDEVPAMRTQEGQRDQKAIGSFKSHIDACPLLVGGFQVPREEKLCFVRQIMQARLSMLMIMIRRIRVCMQQHLASALSRGRLLMIMETDRRLQLIMMKVKMAVG